MGLNSQFSTPARNAAVDAMAALCNTGYLRYYDGTQAANANTAISGQNMLAELRFGATAFGASVAGVATANAITSAAAALTGIANWFRALKSDGTTVVYDGPIGNQTVTLSAGAALSAVSLTVVALTLPLYAGQDLWFVDAVSGVAKKASVTANAAAGATAVTVSALAAAIANASASTQCLLLNSPSIQQNATAGASSLTLTAAAAGT